MGKKQQQRQKKKRDKKNVLRRETRFGITRILWQTLYGLEISGMVRAWKMLSASKEYSRRGRRGREEEKEEKEVGGLKGERINSHTFAADGRTYCRNFIGRRNSDF